MRGASVWCVIGLAAACETAASERAPSGVAAAPVPAAARALADTFAREVVGAVTPGAPAAGAYAMQLAMTFETFPSTEMRITEGRTGALRLTLAADGTARACLGSRGQSAVAGQYHYEPPERREHHERSDARLVALGGTWQVRDGVAAIRLDQVAWGTCELATATQIPAPLVELRCLAVAAGDRLPAGSLLCEASAASQLLDLGMPMTTASRRAAANPMRSAPAGANLALGAPGLAIGIEQGSQAALPAFTFRAQTVTLTEADYRGAPPAQ